MWFFHESCSSRKIPRNFIEVVHWMTFPLIANIGSFKGCSRHLQDVLQRCLQDVFKTYHQVKLFLLTRLREVFNTFLRSAAKTVIYRGICLGHTSEKLMVSVQNLQEWEKFLKFQFFTLLHPLVGAYRDVFRNWSKPAKGLKNWLTLVPSLQISRRKHLARKYAWHHFWKAKGVYAEAAVRRFFEKDVMRNFAEFIRKNLCWNLFFLI